MASLSRTLLSLSYYPLLALNHTCKKVGIQKGSGRLRVLLFHDIAPHQYAEFQRKIKWLSGKWKFITPLEFSGMMKGTKPIKGDNLLLTFDDGFCSDHTIAEQFLNPMGIKAIFFIISEFAKLKDKADQINFITNNLYPPSSKEVLPKYIKSMRSMSLQDLKYLVNTGHTVGCHTATHARLSTIRKEKELVKEIVLSADELENELGVPVEHFSYSFGNLASFSKFALEVARSRFSYIYTGMRGNNANAKPWAIRRDPIALGDSMNLVGAFLEGAADFRYKHKFRIYEAWGVDSL